MSPAEHTILGMTYCFGVPTTLALSTNQPCFVPTNHPCFHIASPPPCIASDLVEYVVQPIRSGLSDNSAYVRKTAVMGVAKLFAVAPSLLKDSDLVNILYNVIKDKDTLVVNAIHALNEILAEESGMAVNTKIVHHLLNRLHTFNEWGQMSILELVSRYRPIFDIKVSCTDSTCTSLHCCVAQTESAGRPAAAQQLCAVLATAKVFLKLTARSTRSPTRWCRTCSC